MLLGLAFQQFSFLYCVAKDRPHLHNFEPLLYTGSSSVQEATRQAFVGTRRLQGRLVVGRKGVWGGEDDQGRGSSIMLAPLMYARFCVPPLSQAILFLFSPWMLAIKSAGITPRRPIGERLPNQEIDNF